MRFEEPATLEEQIRLNLSYHFDPLGGRRTGTGKVRRAGTGDADDSPVHHLVTTCRSIRNLSLCVEFDMFGWCRESAERSFNLLETAHRRADGGYAWLIEGGEVVDDRRSPYGHAFVLLAHASANRFRSDAAPSRIDAILDRFADRNGLLGPSRDSDWRRIETYRGLNANMHACEAYLATYESTGAERFLRRSKEIAETATVELADGDGRIWEHYDSQWEPDYEYNRDEPPHQFRPWGFQPGHHAEWAKLLAGLRRHLQEPWLIRRAEALFSYALEGWDSDGGGFFYTLDRDDAPAVTSKYGWAVAEAIGASAALYDKTGDREYRDWYRKLWSFADEFLIAPEGNWYPRLTEENEPVVATHGSMVDPGYHPVGACYEGLRTFSP